MLRSGFSYSWWDDKPATQETRYWIEDVDLSGLSVWHGPFYAKQIGGKSPARSQAIELTQIGRIPDAAVTHPVKEFAQLTSVSQAQASAASIQQADLADSRAVKIGVKQAGWYRVTQTDLINTGLDPGTNPRGLRLFADGVEVPISVIGEDDGSFDTGDAVDFYGLGLNTPSTDTRVYWLISGDQPGVRINKTQFAAGYPSGESFAYTVERRDRTIHFSALKNGDEENFFGSVVTSGPVRTETHAQPPRTGGERKRRHRGLDSRGHQPPPSSEHQFERLAHRSTRFQRTGASDISLVDFIRVTYQRSYRADNDSLNFTAKAGQTTTINGFSSKNIRVFDVTDERDVIELSPLIEETKIGYAATVTAPVVNDRGLSERKLLALTDDKALRASSLKANSPSQLLDASNAADFIIISDANLLDSLQPLAALRNKQGLATTLVGIEDIYDEFSFGHKSPQSIKDFLLYAATRWKLRPRFVLFAGDASYDARNYLGLGEGDLVPTKLIDIVYLETASDDWFADFNDDGIADLSIGRLPVRTAKEAAAVVTKLIAYDRATPSNEVALVADRNDGFDFEQASQSLRSLIPPGARVTEIFRSQTDDATARSQVIDSINRGQKLVNYHGHGSVTVWRGGLLTAADAPLLTNRERLSFFVAMTCLSAYFQDAMNISLGESLLNAENGGAIAVWASSALCLPQEQATMNQELYSLLFSGSNQMMPLGEIVRQAKASVKDPDIRRTWILLGDPTLRIK